MAQADAPDDNRRALLGASAAMAAGTALSRVSGMLRDIAVVAAIGLGVFADTYSVANTVPNIIYILLAGGALNAVFIPQLVRAMENHHDGGTEYANRLLTATALVLAAVTVGATVLAGPIIHLYSTSAWSDSDEHVAILFARFCLPQIFFYGLFAMFSQVLNSRNVFAAPMFAPIANNVVVIVTAVLFIWVVGTASPSTSSVRTSQIALLGVGTTLGIVVQTLVVWVAMHRCGFHWRLRLGLRGYGLRKAGRLAGWTFVYVLTNQLALLVIARLTTAANVLAQSNPDAAAVGFTSYTKAYLLFILPRSIVTVSLVTAILPRMSRAAAANNHAEVARDVGEGCRLALVAAIPAATALVILGQPLAGLLFGFGNAPEASARSIGTVLAGFAVGLPAFTVFYVVLRGFYALEDTRTPALVNIASTALYVGAAMALFSLAPEPLKVASIATAFTLSYALAAPLMWRLLSGRLGGLPGNEVVRTSLKALAASAGAALVMLACGVAVNRLLGAGDLATVVELLAAGTLGSFAYVLLARLAGVSEIVDLSRMVGGRFTRR